MPLQHTKLHLEYSTELGPRGETVHTCRQSQLSASFLTTSSTESTSSAPTGEKNTITLRKKNLKQSVKPLRSVADPNDLFTNPDPT